MGDQTMFRGDTFTLTGKAVDSNGVPIDITGSTVWFTVKLRIQDPDNQAIALLSTVAPVDQGTVAILNQNQYRGQATAIMNPIATRALPDGPVRCAFDMQVKLPSGVVMTVDSGILTVSPDVTRAI